jgi:SAM-dependent methyltransferase
MTPSDLSGEFLVSPQTHEGLHLRRLSELERDSGVRLEPMIPVGYEPIGRTEWVLATDDGQTAFPTRSGLPIVMTPELLRPLPERRHFDVGAPPYMEAYSEMAHYSEDAAIAAEHVDRSDITKDLGQLKNLSARARSAFPNPPHRWLDATYELTAQWAAFRHLQPLAGTRVLQLGGRGIQAIKLLLAGAAEAWLATPMLGELMFARGLAVSIGVGRQLHCVAAMAEELPFPDDSFDRIYVQGSLHHTLVADALAECRRILHQGGTFAAVEPWRAPLYGLGIRVFGKRDPRVRCEVLTSDRVEPHLAQFSGAEIVHYGALTRYPAVAFGKMGVRPSFRGLWTVARMDDAVSSLVPRLRWAGSSVSILATA